ISGYEAQCALAIESLKTIEQLSANFQVGIYSQPHQHQFIHFSWRANGKRCWPDASHGKIGLSRYAPCGAGALRRRLSGAGLSLPNRQTVLETPSKIPVVGDGTNDLGKPAAGLDEVELSSLA